MLGTMLAHVLAFAIVCAASPKAATKITSLRDIDWCNFTYGGWGGSLHNGRGEVHLYVGGHGQDHDTIDSELQGVVYGDFDADRKVEAAVVVKTTTWLAARNHTYSTTKIHVFKLVNGVPEQLGTIRSSHVTAIAFGKGVVTITQNDGNSALTTQYRRSGTDFVPTTKK